MARRVILGCAGIPPLTGFASIRSSVNARAKLSHAGILLSLGLIFANTALAADVTSQMNRRFEVHDSVEMSHFGTLADSAPDDLDEDGIVSPDGRYFVKVTHRGVLPAGVTEGTIWLFETQSVQRSIRDSRLEVPKPMPWVRMSATANGGLGIDVLDAGNTITSPQWSEDSRSLTFLGRDGRVNRQLFTVDLGTQTVKALTPSNQDVLTYARSGAEFVYLVGPDADLQAQQAWVSSGPGIPDITVGTETPLMPLLYPHFRGNAYGEPLEVELWRVHVGRAQPIVNAQRGAPIKLITSYRTLLVSLSHDGTSAVTIARDAGNAENTNGAASTLRYRITDLRSGVSKPISDAPIARQAPGRFLAAYSRDGSQLAITKVQLAGSRDASKAPTVCNIAIVQLDTYGEQCAAGANEKDKIYSVEWLTGHDAIHARYRRSESPGYADVVLRQLESAWVVDKRAAEAVRPLLDLSVHEGLNDPPVLMATDTHSGRSRPIFDPNPQLASIALGSVSVYRWKDPHGRDVMGGLVMPPDFAPGKRYALVIQTHGFDPGQFFRVGYSDTSNSGRALAARDLLVLQVREPYAKGGGSWRDGTELGLDVYLAAIDKLAAEGLVDPTRVGISGFSYTGWLVANAITGAPQRFAAAEIANSDPVTLTGYYEYVGTPLAATDANFYVGARPYGEGLKTWIDRVPSFSTDKITAPVLFQPADPWHLLGIWDLYAALLDQGKPVELQYMRTGEHVIRKPLQVLAHQEIIVDWFDFWLNGHEDSASTKAKQYERWDKLREARDLSEKSAIH